MIRAVVGLNWGDEGKGRMVDYFARRADCVIRYQGGDNAGHTVINEKGKFAFHNFPSGICYENVLNIVAPGSVLNPESFSTERRKLIAQGLSCDNFILSNRAILIFPFHIVLEKLEEARLADKRYGSTLTGIAPVYGQRYLKKGIQAGAIFESDFTERLSDVVDYVNIMIKAYGGSAISLDETREWLDRYVGDLAPYVKDIAPVVEQLAREGKRIIVEAQLGALRDINHGIYPYTTSSPTLSGYACASIPLPARHLTEVIGVTKAYSTSVGEGPFVTEIFGEKAEHIRAVGKEYGARTGRPRRIGHFDAVATRYGCYLQSATEMAVTCLDVLTGLKELNICTHYEIDGRQTKDFPLNPTLVKASPVYETLPGWSEDITGIRRFEQLPRTAQEYLERIEALCQVPLKYVSVGPQREALIER
jgi:adenylosuccinate synthase